MALPPVQLEGTTQSYSMVESTQGHREKEKNLYKQSLRAH